MRGGDFVCRLGGDEFAVIVDGIDTARTVEEVADRIIAEMRKPFALEGSDVALSLSIGISVFPADARDEQALYRSADMALYRAKNSGRGRWSR